jgi:hypothetical protein
MDALELSRRTAALMEDTLRCSTRRTRSIGERKR